MAQIIVKGLIGEEDLQKYDGTATTFTRANSTGGTSTLTPVGAGSSGLKFAKVFASSVVTLSSNPAASGVLRLATGDFFTWRNAANGADVTLSKSGAVNGNLPADVLVAANFAANAFIANSTTSAASGVVRLQSSDSIGWRNNANGADILLAKDTSDRLTFNGNTVQAPIYNSSGTIQNIAHIVQDTVTLSGGTATVTLTGSAAFSSASSYTCVAIDETGTNAIKVTQTSGSSITFTGTGTDVIRYICIGT